MSLSSASRLPAITWLQVKRLLSLSFIILLHFVFFYALLNGWFFQNHQPLPKTEPPKEIFVSLITPEPPPPAPEPEPEPTPPKPVPIVKKVVTPPPVIPVVNKTPSEQAITTPPLPPAPPQPVVIPPIEPVPTPAPPPPPPPAQPKTVTSGVEYLRPPEPEYPPLSRRMGEEGRVTLRVLVNESGRPTRVDVQKTSGSPRLDEAARQAALRAMFKPHIEDGKAITVYVIVPITFHLDN